MKNIELFFAVDFTRSTYFAMASRSAGKAWPIVSMKRVVPVTKS